MVGDMKLTTIQLVVSAAALAIGISTDLATDSSCLSNIVYQNHVSDARFTLMKPESTWETQLCLVMRASVTNTALITFALALRRYRSSTLNGESELKILVDKMLSIGKIMSRVPSTNFKHVVKFFEYEAGQIKDQLVGGGFAIWVSKTTVRLTMTFYALVGLFCVIRSWRLLPIPMLLITVTSFGWLPVVTNLSELLLGRLSFKVREQAKEAVRVTFWVSMLRGLLVLAQGNLIAAVYGDYEAAMFTYHSYFMVGDALETLAETLTFNFEGFFDFSVETEATMLSIVVWMVELVAIVGTAAPSRFAELVYRIARSISPWLGDKVQTAEKIHQKVSQSSAALTELAKAQAIKKKDTCLSKCFKKKKEWNWKRYARLEGAQLEQPKIEFEAWHAKIKDGLERIESELDPDCENERPCTWCMYGPNWERRSKEQAWQDVLPNYPNGNELAPLRRAKAEDGLITDAALQYLLWNERWPAWCEDRDMKKVSPSRWPRQSARSTERRGRTSSCAGAKRRGVGRWAASSVVASSSHASLSSAKSSTAPILTTRRSSRATCALSALWTAALASQSLRRPSSYWPACRKRARRAGSKRRMRAGSMISAVASTLSGSAKIQGLAPLRRPSKIRSKM